VFRVLENQKVIMAIARETIGKIREAVDIVEVVKEHVPLLKKSGKDFAGLCPFHSEKAPSFYVSPSKNMFYCFGCKQGGDVFKFLMLAEKLTYVEAVRKLGEKAGVKVEFEDDGKTQERRAMLEALTDASAFYHKYLLESDQAQKARTYLAQRGVKPAALEKFRIGYAPDGNKLLQAVSNKYDREFLIRCGLAGVSENGSYYDFMRDRIVFPIFDFTGNVMAFGGRTMRDGAGPLYLNTPDSPVYSKSRSLFGIFQAKGAMSESNSAVVFEGYFDVVVCHQEGIVNAVAPLGTSLTEEHVRTIKRFAQTAALVFDADDSGRQAAVRAGELCLSNELDCKVVSLPQGMDPDEFVLANGAEALKAMVDSGTDAVAFRSDMASRKYDVSKPEGKTKAVREVLETVSKISDAILRYEMLKYVCQRFSVDEAASAGELRKLVSGKGRDTMESGDTSAAFRIRSVEEEIVRLCVAYPEYSGLIPRDMFEDERCTAVLPHLDSLASGKKLSEIIDTLDSGISEWLTGLAFEKRGDYKAPEETLDALLRDLNSRRQEERRRRLEAQVIPMLDGKAPYDHSKVKEYQDLTKLLKGTQPV
jgi:DNA primase